MRDDNFDELLLEALDEGLSSLGDSAKRVIYVYLEKTYKINRQDIPYKIDSFVDAIENFLGSGAKLLEILVIKHLHKKIGHKIDYNQELKVLIFTEYVAAARKTFLKKKKPGSPSPLCHLTLAKKRENVEIAAQAQY